MSTRNLRARYDGHCAFLIINMRRCEPERKSGCEAHFVRTISAPISRRRSSFDREPPTLRLVEILPAPMKRLLERPLLAFPCSCELRFARLVTVHDRQRFPMPSRPETVSNIL